MSFFEALMLVCFGAAWPASIYKSYVSRSIAGKSLWFMIIVETGYIAGVIHKIFYNYDPVIWLYVANLVMVALDIGLYARNYFYIKQQMATIEEKT